jgi:hypothetical protein
MTETQQERQEGKGKAPPRQRGAWTKVWLLLGVLIALGVGALMWAASERRHRASTYGIIDPSVSALIIENKTSDFAISRITIADAEGVALRDVGIEIGVGGETVLEIAPGVLLISVHYVETSMVVLGRPQGFLSESISVMPGKAVLVSFQGGRSSPEGSMFIPPLLVVR